MNGVDLIMSAIADLRADVIEVKGDVKEVWAEARKTNGRVNDHDTRITVIEGNQRGRVEWRVRIWNWGVTFVIGAGTATLAWWLKTL